MASSNFHSLRCRLSSVISIIPILTILPRCNNLITKRGSNFFERLLLGLPINHSSVNIQKQ